MPKPTVFDARRSLRPLPDSTGAFGWLTDLVAIAVLVGLLALVVSLLG